MALSEEIKGISVKIGANTTELSSALKGINAQVQGTGASLKEINKLLKMDPSSTELLTQKQRALATQIDAAKSKLDALKQAQEEAKKMLASGDIDQGAYDKLSRDIIAAEQNLKKLQEDYDSTTKKTKENTKATEENADAAEQSSTNWKKVGTSLKTAGVAIAAATAAAAAAAVTLGKEVVSAFADYEQLTGGIETLFKDSNDTVLKYADEAYKTAGMSANEYMETVTSFSATLINSLDGDTAKAAEQSDKAIRQMSDNANKMGTNIESLQNAYTGFAKGNYTMLDNLSLGFAGTKGGMEQLLAKASELAGVKFDINSYSDIIDAIGVIQDSMGITGTTAKEAEKTISGSIASVKAAWTNLMTALGSGKDVDKALNNVTKSFKNVLNNIQPVVTRLIQTLPTVINAIMPTIQAMLPEILKTATELLSQVFTGLVASIPALIPVIVELLQNVINVLIENSPLLIDAGVTLLGQLIAGMLQALPDLVEGVVQIISGVVDTITEHLDDFIIAGGEILTNVISGLFSKLPDLITTAAELVTQLITTIIENLPQFLIQGIEIINSIITGIVNAIPTLIEMVPQIIISIITTLIENLPQIIEQGIGIITALITGLIEAIPQLIMAIPEIIAAIVNTFKEYDWASIGTNIIEGIKRGILNAWESLKEAVCDVAEKVKDSFEDLFDIESPSKWMREHIGKNLDLGLAAGIEKYKNIAVSTANTVGSAVQNAFGNSVKYDYGTNHSAISVTTPVYLDGKVIATVVNNRLGVML